MQVDAVTQEMPPNPGSANSDSIFQLEPPLVDTTIAPVFGSFDAPIPMHLLTVGQSTASIPVTPSGGATRVQCAPESFVTRNLGGCDDAPGVPLTAAMTHRPSEAHEMSEVATTWTGNAELCQLLPPFDDRAKWF